MRTSHRAVAIAAVVVVATGGVVAPARAALTADLGIYRNTSVVDTASRKSVSAPCPNGLKVFGAGGEIDGGNGHVVLDEVVPTTR